MTIIERAKELVKLSKDGTHVSARELIVIIEGLLEQLRKRKK